MTEMLCTSPVDDITTLIKECQFPPEALFLAERLPQQVIVDAKERRDLLRFTYFATNIPFVSYTSGRIFQQDYELRWEKNNGKTQVVYLGVERHLPGKWEMHTLDELQLKQREQPKYYYLFGERLRQEQLEQIGKPAVKGDFAELRIPRLLRYPVQLNARRRVRLAVCEYVRETTGDVELFRFQGLEAVE